MTDDTTPDSELEADEPEENEAEGGAHKKHQGSTDSAAPADDDIIIK